MTLAAGMGPRELVARAYAAGRRAGEAGDGPGRCPYQGPGRRELLGRIVWVRGYVLGSERRRR